MNDAFYIAATGMRAHQTSLDAVANNLVNVNTVGYKRSNVVFTDLVSSPASSALTQDGYSGVDNNRSLEAIHAGVGIASSARQFEIGDMKKTDSVLDIAIQGDGFLEVMLPDGNTAYTRGGSLKISKDGTLMSPSGLPLKPGIVIPENAQNMTITPDGHVQVSISGQSGMNEIGQLTTVKFNNPGGLTMLADNLYRASNESGEPVLTLPGESGTGLLAQGMLESSNVKMVDEMMNMMLAQRAYEASMKILQASDELSAMTNNLRKG